jgi:hypothetical protein
MKTHINLRLTFSNRSWPQRGLAVLAVLAVAAVVGITLIQALRAGLGVDPAAPAAQIASPAQSTNSAPISGAGSAYDGGAYVEYLLSSPAAQTPNVPISGAGSAYDGGAYGAARSASALTRVPYEAGWQLYDNGWAGGPRTLPQSQTGSGAGSVFDGGAHGTVRPAAQAQQTGLGIDPPAGVDLRELPAGLTDYVRRSQ